MNEPWLLPGPATPEVNAGLRAQVEELLGEYERIRKEMGTLQEKLAAATGEAKAKENLIQVSVGPRGNLTGLRIEPRAYRRYSPTELAEEILALARAASEDVTGQVEGLMAPFLPKGVSYADALTGKTGIADWFPSEPLTADAFRDWWAKIGNPDAGPQQDGPR